MYRLVVALMLASLSPVLAQTPTAAVTGTIKDGRETLLSGVAIRLTAEGKGTVAEAKTGADGEFRISTLPPGVYRLLAELAGSRIETGVEIAQSGQVLNVGVLVLATAAAATPAAAPATAEPPAQDQVEPVYEKVTVTARRVEEELQDVPVPVSVIGGKQLDAAAAFNVNRLKELVPTVQFYSSNPRNTAVNIRGLGSPFGLTNDGIEPGVGFYVDGVFYARPAAGTLDFLDLERVEVLRGPQGTLFGKNTTAGAINITTRRPTFTPEQNFELSFGNLGFIQAKGSISGPLGKKVAGRLAFSGTQRDGQLYNVRTQDDVNDLNNQGIRGQLLVTPRSNVTLLLAADYTRQRPEGYAQVVVGVAPTLRPANRQYNQIAADFGYRPPSFNAFDRLIDTDTPWRSKQDMGGASVTLDWDRGSGVLTAITAWRFWDWDPSNDRDFTGLPVTTISAAPSKHSQWTQEVRYAGSVNSRLNYLLGVFTFHQKLKPSPFHKQEQGSAAARFLLAPSALAATPGLLDGYGQNISFDYRNTSTAGFGQVEYALTNRLRIIPGLRYNYDQKKLDYDQQVYGGLQTTNAALIALQRSILSPLTYKTDIGDHNVSGQITVAHKTGESYNTYFTYSTGFKSIGLNLGGVPTDAAGNPIVSAATVKPERVSHFEIGIKTQPRPGISANFTAFNTDIKDFQTQVVNAQVGVLRGYLANAAKVRVRGIEFDGSARLNPELTVYGSAAFTDGRYLSFTDAPPPVEDTGGPQVKDVSGSVLPGISKWAFSTGGEYARNNTLFGIMGQYYARLDASYRSDFSSSPSASRYLNINGYSLLNPRVGFRSKEGWSVSLWARNLAGSNYFELLSPAPGNSGLFVGLPGDKRTFGITLAKTFVQR